MGPSRHYHRKFRFSDSRGSFAFCVTASRKLFPSGFLRTLKTSYWTASRSLKIVLTFAFLRSSPRPISIDNLIHHCIYSVNLSTLSSSRGLTGLCHGILVLEGGFTLRCFQRLSRPHFASLLCRWHDNSCTRGASTPVLSY